MAFGEVGEAVGADFFPFARFVVVQRFASAVDAGGDVDPFRALSRTGNQAVAGRRRDGDAFGERHGDVLELGRREFFKAFGLGAL